MRQLFILLCLASCCSQGISQSLTMKKANAHIYLLAGQSNMAGRGTVEPVDTITNPHIWMLNKDDEWVLAHEPLAFDKPKVVGVGPGFAFAKEIWKEDTTATILLVPSAVGGTRIDLWVPGAYDSATKTHPYDDAMRRMKKALQFGVLKGIIWHQGESDCTPELCNSYEGKLRALIQRFRTELKAEKVPFILGEIANFKGEVNKEKEMVNKAIQNVASSTKLSGWARINGLQHRGDFLHFDAPSARELGRRYAVFFEKGH